MTLHVLTQEQLLDLLTERFGTDPMAWAFKCPGCGDVATGQDFRDALDADPRHNRDGSATTASDVIGQQCIGRFLGVLSTPATVWKGRGCDWVAFGLIRGPWAVDRPDSTRMYCFPVAEVAEVTR